MLKLRIEDDEGQETIVPIIRDEITIGRQDGNTIRLTERNVSRRHARLILEGDHVFVEGISARYGITKNGQRIEDREAFTPQDVFVIGDYRLTLQAEGAPALKGPPSGASGPNGARATAEDFAGEPTAIKPLHGTQPRRDGTEVLPALPAKLVIVSSNFAGQEFPLNRPEIVIGRGEDCDIIIDHRSVSQKHAKVLRESNARYQIVDLNSKNGVRIHDDKYTSTHLKRGDIVEMGHVKFRFVEPGENYVFTPQPEFSEPSAFGAKISRTPLLLGIGAGLGLLFAIVAAVLAITAGGDREDDTVSANTPPVTSTVDNAKEPDQQGVALIDEPSSNPKISQGIEDARELISQGEIDKAIGILEGMSYADPSPEDSERIAKLVAQAKTERPIREDFLLVKSNKERERYADALEVMNRIPTHTLFYKILKDRGMRDEVIAGAEDEAREAIDGEEWTEAEDVIELLEASGQGDDLREALETAREDKKRVAAAASKPTRAPRPEPKRRPVKRPDPPEEKVSAEDAKALVSSARQDMFKGNYEGAISKCKKALKAGELDCHLTMGIAYQRQGNNKKACQYFKRALSSNPSNASAIRGKIDKIEGCSN